MILNRLKQFYWGMNPKIQGSDVKFVNKILDENEKRIFLKLPNVEQKHAIRVARDIIKFQGNYKNIDIDRLTKAALLHDIGKVDCKMNVIDKSIIVILDKITRGRIKRFCNIKKVDTYFNHGKKGYDILKDQVQDDKLLELVLNHHKKGMCEDEEMKLLKLSDDRN